MVFYSEDKANMSVSKLISSLLDIEFCDSNSNILRLLNDKNSSDYNVYLDVVPDNKKIVGDYNRILGTYDAYADRNINIIPIPCTEYYVIKALDSIGVDFKFKYDWVAIVIALMFT